MKKYISLPQHPSGMSDDELMAYLADEADSVIIRSLLMAEVEDIRSGAYRERRTMRNLWYRLVKPALSRAGILNKLTTNGRPVTWDAKLSRYLAELVRLGVTSYEELSIVDGSRLRRVAAPVSTTLMEACLVGAHYPWVILFSEKDTIFEDMRAVAALYGVSCISGSGQPSYACTEHSLRAIVRSDAFQREKPEDIILLSLTDFDPAGFYISDAQHQQILEVTNALPPEDRGDLQMVRYRRIGLTPDQLTEDEVAANAYEPKDKGLRKWLEETGGINGEPLGLELDALPLSRLRRMFADGIERYVDLGARRHDLQIAYIDLLSFELLRPIFDEQRQRLLDAVQGSDIWATMSGLSHPEDMFRNAAEQGLPYIDPTRHTDLFNDYTEAVRSIMRTALGRES